MKVSQLVSEYSKIATQIPYCASTAVAHHSALVTARQKDLFLKANSYAGEYSGVELYVRLCSNYRGDVFPCVYALKFQPEVLAFGIPLSRARYVVTDEPETPAQAEAMAMLTREIVTAFGSLPFTKHSQSSVDFDTFMEVRRFRKGPHDFEHDGV